MSRVKLLSAMPFDRQTWEDQQLADPVIRVYGELPATAQPFGIHRVYQGPQGTYEEAILLVDPDNVVIWERPYRYIELRGEMYEDRFQSFTTAATQVESTKEHTLVFLIDGSEAGRVPVFIDAPESLQTAGAFPAAMNAALQKSAVMWLTIPQKDGSSVQRPAWYVQEGDTLYVLSGPEEQDLTNIEACDVVRMTVKSKDIHAAIGDVDASVEVVPSDSDIFERVAEQGLEIRLNSQDGLDATLRRWKDTCTMVALTPQV